MSVRTFHRIRFEEITEAAIRRAVASPSDLDQNLIAAQATRRTLDRLVGYQVSPLLRAFGPHQSTGRVQSAALHLVVQRELELRVSLSVPRGTRSTASW